MWRWQCLRRGAGCIPLPAYVYVRICTILHICVYIYIHVYVCRFIYMYICRWIHVRELIWALVFFMCIFIYVQQMSMKSWIHQNCCSKIWLSAIVRGGRWMYHVTYTQRILYERTYSIGEFSDATPYLYLSLTRSLARSLSCAHSHLLASSVWFSFLRSFTQS